MSDYIPVKDHPDLVRDPNTNMILNIYKSNHKRKKLVTEAKMQERAEIDQLKSDVNDIKMMLQKLLENGTNG